MRGEAAELKAAVDTNKAPIIVVMSDSPFDEQPQVARAACAPLPHAVSDSAHEIAHQCAAAYAFCTSFGTRPRSETVYPFTEAHSRTAFKSSFGAAVRDERVRAVAESALRAAVMYGSSTARKSAACSSVRSIAYDAPSTPNATLSPAPSSICSCERSSTSWTRYFCAISAPYKRRPAKGTRSERRSCPRLRLRERHPNWDSNYTGEVCFVRHAARGLPMHAFARQGGHMSAPANRIRRADNSPTVLLQGRVSPQVKSEIAQAAEASGVSLAYYLEALFTDLVAEHGRLPLVATPSKHTQQELPIHDAA